MKSHLLGLLLMWTNQTTAHELLQAEKAIQEGDDLAKHQHWRPHVLYPDLEAAHLMRHSDDIPRVQAFLQQHDRHAFSSALALAAYRHWLPHQPQAIVESYREHWSTPEINCLYQEAQRRLQQPRQALPLAPQCLHLFDLPQLRQHVEKALQQNQKKTVQEALPHLPADEQQALQQWLAGDEVHHPLWRSKLLAIKIHDLSPKKTEEALFWARLEPLQAEDYAYGHNRLLSHLARQNHPATYEIWAQMPPGTQQDNVILDLIAYVLRRQDWEQLPHLLARLDAKSWERAEIQYWLGRAAERRGQSGQARAHYRRAASQRDYFGFLAAEKIQKTPALNHRPIIARPALQKNLERGVTRALLFRQLGLHQRAQREWQALAKNRPSEDIEQLAWLLHRRQWHLAAITLLAQHQLWDALEIRFPILYRPQIEALAAQHGLKPSQILAIIRKESIFQAHIQSSAGAIGLMQLMPATAKETAQRHGIPYAGKHQLVQPELNLQLGSHYLSERLQEFGHLAYAAAAYNAGSRRVHQWLQEHPGRPLDEWIALIPFNETRDYVKKVLEYEKIYDALWAP